MLESLATCLLPSPVGEVLCVVSSAGLCGLYLDGPAAQARLERWQRKHAPLSEVHPLAVHEGRIAPVAEQLAEYFAGQRQRFQLALDLRGTDFQREVWAELQRVPFGSTVSYGELGRRLGRPGASRAVGAANGANPVPIVVPCHRVVAAAGLGGFSGGLPRKLHLLQHEGVLLPW